MVKSAADWKFRTYIDGDSRSFLYHFLGHSNAALMLLDAINFENGYFGWKSRSVM